MTSDTSIENTTQTVSKALELLGNCETANTIRNGRLYTGIEDIPGNLCVLADYNKLFDKLMDEGLMNDYPNGEELEAILRKGLSKTREIHYFEVYFGDRKSYGEGEQPSICIMGIRQPSVEEANEFCKVDSYCFGQSVTEVEEMNKNYVENCLDLDQNLPVFGIDRPKSLADAGFARWDFPLFMDATTIANIAVYAKTQDKARSAVKETMAANPEMVFTHMAKCGPRVKFIVADHGGLEPLPPDAI